MMLNWFLAAQGILGHPALVAVMRAAHMSWRAVDLAGKATSSRDGPHTPC
jgi:hypothetical protein